MHLRLPLKGRTGRAARAKKREDLADDDDSVRIRLEGRLELLEAARSRYRLLQLKVLGRLRWKLAARRNAVLLREVAQEQAHVDEALAHVERRAAAEGWKPRSEAVRCAREVRALKDGLDARAAALLEASLATTFAERLLEVERVALRSPRLILPGQRMATALELLPASLPELREVAAFGALLERAFKRPEGVGPLLPFEPGELEGLEERFPAGEAALAAAWGRIRPVDQAGTLGRYLARLSRRMPMHPPKNGVEALLAAEFWKSYGLARLNKLVAARVSPLEARPHELFPVARWLWKLERGDAAPLAASATLPPGRAALFELARELLAQPPGRASSPRAWDRLEEHAARAQGAATDPDAAKLADNLRLLLRVLSRDRRGGAPQGAETLRDLVAALRSLAAR